MDAAVSALLHLLRAEPTLLPLAPAGEHGDLIDRRTRFEMHPCLRCGQTARCAVLVNSDAGWRFLDLCSACFGWLRRGSDEPPAVQP